jgi:hypothetical protein
MTADIYIIDAGTLVGLLPHSRAGKDWTDERLLVEGWQVMGNTIWCDPRLALPIIEGMIGDGLTVEATHRRAS